VPAAAGRLLLLFGTNLICSMSSAPSKAYNAAVDLIERNLAAGRAAKVAYIDDRGMYSYSELADRALRCVSAFRHAGLEPGDRVILALLDTIDFPSCFLGAIRAGIVPIPLNTRCTGADFAAILGDSPPRACIVAQEILPVFEEATRLAHWGGDIHVVGGDSSPPSAWMATGSPDSQAAVTRADDVCFWLYSSGSTGNPKGVIHRHGSLIQTAELYGQGVLGITEHDVVFSAAKLFFAYGLGNALTFPLSVGAAAILCSGRPTPARVNAILREQRPTIFFGVPTLYSALLASPDLPTKGEHGLRLCVSAGEALPEKVGSAWRERTGVDIIDGFGSDIAKEFPACAAITLLVSLPSSPWPRGPCSRANLQARPRRRKTGHRHLPRRQGGGLNARVGAMVTSLVH
jgi:benzoate-CoA ligase